MTKLCLDTSAYSHFKAGHAEVITTIRRARTVCVPSVVLGELRAGFKLGSKCDHNEEDLRAFLSNAVVTVLDVDSDTSFHYAEIFAELRRNGTPIPSNDIWIAALAVREGATILTFDAHFAVIKRASVLLLQP